MPTALVFIADLHLTIALAGNDVVDVLISSVRDRNLREDVLKYAFGGFCASG